jgi:hypothetical protein
VRHQQLLTLLPLPLTSQLTLHRGLHHPWLTRLHGLWQLHQLQLLVPTQRQHGLGTSLHPTPAQQRIGVRHGANVTIPTSLV